MFIPIALINKGIVRIIHFIPETRGVRYHLQLLLHIHLHLTYGQFRNFDSIIILLYCEAIVADKGMFQKTESEIIKSIRKGNEAAFNVLFDKYYTALCFFVDKYLKDMDLSRSLVQGVFVNLWEKREKLSIRQSVKSYLYTSVKNSAIDYLRKEKEKIPLSESLENLHQVPFQDLIEEAELNDRINKSINNLPAKCREIFVLCRFEGMKYAEIAKQQDISVKTVEMQMGIALKKIRKYLSDLQMINLLVFVKAKKS